MSRPSPVISPASKYYISKKKRLEGKPCSRTDYEREMKLLKEDPNNYNIMWDDTKNNSTKQPGGLFGFTHLHSHVEWFLVLEVHPSTERQSWWSSHVGHRERNVLRLSKKLYDMPWTEFVSCREGWGASKSVRVMGTTTIKTPENAPGKIWDCVQRETPFYFNHETGEFIHTEHTRKKEQIIYKH